jgi:DNA-directed RNA polymerase subunit RPC12/RpoP
MAQKDIYKIDNYLIATGVTLLILGCVFMVFDPFLYSEVVITEKVGDSTQVHFESKEGRTLDQIRQKYGNDAEVDVRTFPTIRVIMVANGIILLIIGYSYRRQERKIINLWNALERLGEAKVTDLSVMLGLPREFIIRHLKDINLQHHTLFTYEQGSDKIINSKLRSEYLINVDCANCGSKVNQKVTLDLASQPNCPYCGTPVSTDYLNNLRQEVLKSTQSIQESTRTKKGEFSVVIFILLLIFFWPAAIVYLVIKKTAMNKSVQVQSEYNQT